MRCSIRLGPQRIPVLLFAGFQDYTMAHLSKSRLWALFSRNFQYPEGLWAQLRARPRLARCVHRKMTLKANPPVSGHPKPNLSKSNLTFSLLKLSLWLKTILNISSALTSSLFASLAKRFSLGTNPSFFCAKATWPLIELIP
jgi:hypothetical protein